ncbi:MAG: hypothetical protein ACRC2J_15260 [Microcoleaceae cyanobacterium]
MEILKMQVDSLTRKVDLIYAMIEEMNVKLSLELNTRSMQNYQARISDNFMTEYLITEEDELVDNLPHNYSRYQQDHQVRGAERTIGNSIDADQELGAYLQLQRLTAQLTAAYNRIAALEEQLLSTRINTH